MSKFPFLPEQASTTAPQVDALFLFIAGIGLFFAVLIAAAIIVFAIKYRRRSPDDVPAPLHGSTAVELTWTIIPFILAMVIFFWSASVFLTLSRPPDDALEILVVGKQWMWKLQHMEGRREINQLHVPVGRPIKLTMTSEDVIHSFFVPAFRIKADVLPGRYTTTWFEATKPGTYHLFCTEYCGTEHSRMIGKIVVLEPSDYQDWLAGKDVEVAGGGEAAPQSAGEALFRQKGCATCHQNLPGALGPSLAGIFGKAQPLASGETVTVDEAYLRESILNPGARVVAGYKPLMPTFQGQLTEEQILELIQYIKSLPAPAPAVAEAATEAARGGGQDS